EYRGREGEERESVRCDAQPAENHDKGTQHPVAKVNSDGRQYPAADTTALHGRQSIIDGLGRSSGPARKIGWLRTPRDSVNVLGRVLKKPLAAWPIEAALPVAVRARPPSVSEISLPL